MFEDNLYSIQKWATNYLTGGWALTEFNVMMNSTGRKWVKNLVQGCTLERSGSDSYYLNFPDGSFIELEDDEFFSTQHLIWELLKEIKDEENESL